MESGLNLLQVNNWYAVNSSFLIIELDTVLFRILAYS